MLFTIICKGQDKVKIYTEQTENGYNIYADNHEFCPVTIKVDFTTVNLTTDGVKENYVIPPQTNKQLLNTLLISKKEKSSKFSYEYWFNYGNHNKKTYDIDYAYDLPYSKAQEFQVYQGYNGTQTHQNVNALDFPMPIGTKITAIRKGVVIKVVDNNKKHGNKEKYNKYNNFVMIYHDDGTFAEYAHIKKSGSVVKVGDLVKKGQTIAYSGNVGWSTGPHLHLVVFLQKLKSRKTLETKFRTGDGDKIEYLIEGKHYTKNY